MTEKIDPDDVPDEVLRSVVNSKGFQRMVAYQKLAEGISVLEENDAMYDTLVNSIRDQSKNISSASSIEEVLDLLVKEVEDYTADMAESAAADEDHELMDPEDLAQAFTQQPTDDGDHRGTTDLDRR